MKTLNEKIMEARKALEPIRQSFTFVFNSPPGEAVIDALERSFGDRDIPKDKMGAVDPNAVLIQVGRREVIDFIRRLAAVDNEGQGT